MSEAITASDREISNPTSPQRFFRQLRTPTAPVPDRRVEGAIIGDAKEADDFAAAGGQDAPTPQRQARAAARFAAAAGGDNVERRLF